MLMKYDRNLSLVYVIQPMVKLGSLYVVSLKVTEVIDDIKWGLTVYATICLSMNLLMGVCVICYFHCFTIVNSAVINTSVQVFVSRHFPPISFGYLLMSRIAGSCVNSTCSILRSHPNCFPWQLCRFAFPPAKHDLLFHSNHPTKEVTMFFFYLC